MLGVGNTSRGKVGYAKAMRVERCTHDIALLATAVVVIQIFLVGDLGLVRRSGGALREYWGMRVGTGFEFWVHLTKVGPFCVSVDTRRAHFFFSSTCTTIYTNDPAESGRLPSFQESRQLGRQHHSRFTYFWVKKGRLVHYKRSTSHNTNTVRCSKNRNYVLRAQQTFMTRKTAEWKDVP